MVYCTVCTFYHDLKKNTDLKVIKEGIGSMKQEWAFVNTQEIWRRDAKMKNGVITLEQRKSLWAGEVADWNVELGPVKSQLGNPLERRTEKEMRTMSKDLGDTEGKIESPERHLVGGPREEPGKEGERDIERDNPSFPELKQAESPSEQAHCTLGKLMAQNRRQFLEGTGGKCELSAVSCKLFWAFPPSV